ncbi:ABC transporter substrate-binding protein [Nocardiopsis exhalans]|uniref:ABC transporter substrate-binding protein n=1 Tax=Nocardiopsis exhalans TaxID=163604 RepID=A0ABY5CZJ9_9ACTN|nr:ABC transporter substrate-binding protein [Nocardiopsis exhalans]USY17264.1 ABC transporter substrate-binding protein [Nocardiopsis exhalans]
MRSTRPFPLPLACALAAGILLVSGCGSADGASPGPASDDAETRTVQTDQGEVTVPADPQRVVVLNYALAGYLYGLDVPVVATVPEDADGEGAYSDFWAEDAEQDGTGFLPWSTDGFDLEAVLGAEPDLIVAGGLGFPLFQAIEVYDQLSEIAPTVVVSGSHATWQEQYGFLAEEVFDEGERYEELVAAYDERVEEVREAITPPPGPVTFLVLTADHTPYALIEDTGLPRTFERLGLETDPLFAENDVEPYTTGGDMFELSTEQVGQMVTAPTVFVLGFNGDTADVATVSESDVYSALPAFEGGHAYDLPHWVLRGDYDEEMALLDIVEEQFS